MPAASRLCFGFSGALVVAGLVALVLRSLTSIPLAILAASFALMGLAFSQGWKSGRSGHMTIEANPQGITVVGSPRTMRFHYGGLSLAVVAGVVGLLRIDGHPMVRFPGPYLLAGLGVFAAILLVRAAIGSYPVPGVTLTPDELIAVGYERPRTSSPWGSIVSVTNPNDGTAITLNLSSGTPRAIFVDAWESDVRLVCDLIVYYAEHPQHRAELAHPDQALLRIRTGGFLPSPNTNL